MGTIKKKATRLFKKNQRITPKVLAENLNITLELAEVLLKNIWSKHSKHWFYQRAFGCSKKDMLNGEAPQSNDNQIYCRLEPLRRPSMERFERDEESSFL